MLYLLLKPLHFTFRLRSATARSMSCATAASTQRMFQLKHDPLTGKSEWVVIEEEENDARENQTTPHLATTSYLDMLNDARRNRAFRQAIDKTVTKPCHVLDIGAGTGLLSLMAARAMGPSGTVTACESYLPMVKSMRKVLRANDMDGKKIRIINKRSDELKVGFDMPSRADVLVSEILDSELLGEGLIPSLQHAYDNLLVENPLTVPYRATIYSQLVECTYLWEMHDLFSKESKASDGIHLVLPSGVAGFSKKQQFAMHCDGIEEEIKVLSEPFEVFDFDFWRRPDSFRETEMHVKAINAGTVHAIISWWLLQLDSEGTIFYSTAPKWIPCPSELTSSSILSSNWCDHWKQSVWFGPSSGLPVFKDEEVHLHAVHNETSISYEFRNSQQKKKEVAAYGKDFCTQIFNLSPERNALYGDSGWRCLMLNAIEKALCHREHSLCLVADDSIFLTIAIAHLSKTSHVIPLFPGLGKRRASQYLQMVAEANNYTMDRIEILNKKEDLQSKDSLKKIDLLVAEPFYYGNDSVLPWQNLRFWKERTTVFDSILSKDVVIMPCKGLLKVCAMYLPDFWRSRCCLTEIEGFDHSVVNTTLGACGGLENSPFLPFFVWQCGETKILSEMSTIMEFDFSKPMNPCSGKAEIEFTESGMCHGFVLWMDWVMDVDNNTILSTGPDKRYWKQAVKLLNKPVEVKSGTTEMEAFFDPSDGELTIQHAMLK
ncbi:hypothetical protein BUALT_Bualt09G0048200 [Buddleja alternifolia]|uniref:Protein arginine N-methyltransferase n=1 Tax=Buddleja alternifolia TaxID=168488 RepID=A0AAV6X1G0_9LAMI|nr:hypothetical protein BUALT_Bualt09G0048200 [Buddleja alternifolia]